MDIINTTLNDRYLVKEYLGTTLLTAIYKGTDKEENTEILLNVVNREKCSSRIEDIVRFEENIRKVSPCDSPHIARVLDTREDGENLYTVTEYFKFETLKSLVEKGKKFDIEETLDIIYQIVSGLNITHNHNVLHLDLNPDNIATFGKGSIKIINFGLSYLLDYTVIKDIKELLEILAYVSPEQAGILKTMPDERSDLYSLGIILYQLLTGELPFQASSTAELLHLHISQVPVPPRNKDPKIPEVLEEMILKLLEKDPQQRYQGTQGLMSDLEKVRSGDTAFVVGKDDFLRKLTYRTRLIGREEELSTLKSLFEESLGGEGKLTLIAGEAGRGKSRLTEEFSSFLRKKDVVFISGKCFAQENKIPYQVFRDILNDYIEKIGRLEPVRKEGQIKRIKEVLGELGEIILRINPNMKNVIGETPPLVPLDPVKEHRRFLMISSNFFLNLSTKETPVVLFLDDIQWADEGSLSILEEMTAHIKNFPLFLIGAYRDNEVDQEHTLSKIKEESKEKHYALEEIKLGVFSHGYLNKFISQLLLEDEESVYELSEYILGKSQGNPFFSTEILRQLIDQKGLVYQEEKKRWYVDWDKIKEISIPTNIVDIVLKRIETLGRENLNLLSYASCIGREFQIEFLFQLIDLPREKIITLVDRSISLQLIEKSLERGKLLFVHDRIKDAFYKRLNAGEKKSIHSKIAQVLEEFHRENLDPFLFELTHHYSEAEDKDKTLQYSLPSAIKAQHSFANQEAVKYYKTTKAILLEKDQKDQKYIEVLEGLGDVLRLQGLYDEAIENFKECQSLIEGKMGKSRLLQKIGDTLFQMGNVHGSIEALQEALKVLGRRHVPKNPIAVQLNITKLAVVQTLARLFPRVFINDKYKTDPEYLTAIKTYLRLFYCYYFTDMMQCVLAGLFTLNLAEKTGDSETRANVYIIFSTVPNALSMAALSEMYVKEGLNISLRINSKLMEGFAYVYFAFSYLCANRLTDAIENGRKAIKILPKLGERWELAVGYCFTSHSYWPRGELVEDYRHSQEYVGWARAVKDPRTVGWALYHKARNEATRVDLDEGISGLKEALEYIRLSKEEVHVIMVWISYIRALLRKGNYEETVKNIDEAYPIAIRCVINMTMGVWACQFFGMAADAYMTVLREKPEVFGQGRKAALKKIKALCRWASFWGFRYKVHLGLACRVNGRYQWLFGNKRKALKYFEKGIKFTEACQHKYLLGLIYFELGKLIHEENPKSKFHNPQKAKENLLKAGAIFEEIDAKFDLEDVNKLLGVVPLEEATLQQKFSQERRLRTLISVSHLLSSILDLDKLLEKILESSINVSGAERGFLLLYSPERKLEVKVVQGLDKDIEVLPELDFKKYKLSPSIIKEAQDKNQSLLVNPTVRPDVLKDEQIRAYRIKSIIITPLKAREEVLGFLYLDNRLVEEAFSQDDLELIDSLSIQATISLQNAFLVKEMVEKQRLEEELKLGRDIQQSLLPSVPPEVKGLRMSGFMLPAKEIGGDYYDFVKLTEGEKEKLYIAIGDVSGKGLDAGLYMAMAKTAIYTVSSEEISPKKILSEVNRIIHTNVGEQKFMSLLYFLWNPEANILTYSSCGHEHIIISRSGSKELEIIKSGGIIMGMLPDISSYLEEHDITLNSGDKLILYTDGVTDAQNKKGQRYGMERFQQAILKYSSKPLTEFLQSLKEEIFSYIEDSPQYDDITLVGIEKE